MRNEKNILKRFINKPGIILCSMYLLIILLCLFMAYNSGGDFKGNFVFMQLPIVFQLALLDILGLTDFLREISWTTAYLTIVPATCIYLMLVGKSLQVIKEKLIKWNEY